MRLNLARFQSCLFEHSELPRGVLLLSLLVLFGTLAYVVFGISIVVASLTLILSVIVTVILAGIPRLSDDPWIPSGYIERFLLVYVIALQGFLLWMLWSSRTDVALQTPWYGAGLSFFLLFAFESAALFWLTFREPSRLQTLATVIHFFLTYGVALTVFRYGYGYDPIIHQTAEDVVVRDGRIFPLQPFYIGQYALVAIAHHLTQLPVWLIDRALLPLLASVSIPFVALRGFVHGYGLEEKTARVLTLLLPIIAIPFLTFTVPYNLTVLLLLWWVLLAPCIRNGGRWGAVLLLLAGAAALIHPLLGIPLVIATLLLVIAYRWHVLWAIVGGMSVALSLLAMLGVYRIMHGATFVASWAFWEQPSRFVELFSLPFLLNDAPWSLVILYRWEQILPWLIVLLGCIGLWRARTIPAAVRLSIASLGFGLLGGMYLVRTMIDLPGIVPYEQAEFVLRLRETIPIVFLPAALMMLVSVVQIRPSPFRRGEGEVKNISVAILVGALLAVSWYVTYPQVNAVSWRVGWNVQKADAEVVAAIERDANGRSYVVLADRVLAAVALRELGFRRTMQTADGRDMFVYALEPDQILFPYAERLLYYGLSATDFTALQRDTRVDRVYIAIHDYWYRREAITNELRSLGAQQVAMPDGVQVFVLTSPLKSDVIVGLRPQRRR